MIAIQPCFGTRILLGSVLKEKLGVREVSYGQKLTLGDDRRYNFDFYGFGPPHLDSDIPQSGGAIVFPRGHINQVCGRGLELSPSRSSKGVGIKNTSLEPLQRRVGFSRPISEDDTPSPFRREDELWISPCGQLKVLSESGSELLDISRN